MKMHLNLRTLKICHQGEYETAEDIAEYWVTQENESTKNLPDWLEIAAALIAKQWFEELSQ